MLAEGGANVGGASRCTATTAILVLRLLVDVGRIWDVEVLGCFRAPQLCCGVFFGSTPDDLSFINAPVSL